ncbi:MAG: stage V sporulation protein E, partial [Chloroflexi bacterium]|nr:stage V sporulation protein E [Chloroflexota bacterium]
MKGAVRCDRWLIWITAVLVLVGMLTVYTASAHIAERSFGGTNVFLRRNVLRAALGVIAMLAAYHVDYRAYRKHARKGIFFAIGLLALTLVFADPVRGMRGFWLMFQPSELAKLALVVYLADVLARRQDSLDDFFRGVVPWLAVALAVVGLVAVQPDYGSALGLVALISVMLFLGGVRLRHLLALVGASVIGVGFLVRHIGYISSRVAVWKPTFDLSLEGLDLRGAAYQIFQSLVALGSGSVVGLGVGASRQRAFIPDSHTDFAFSIWGEELGLVGTAGLVVVFVLLMVRGLRVAKRAPDLYGTLLAGGLTAMV